MDYEINNPPDYNENDGTQYNDDKNVMRFSIIFLLFISFCSVFSRCFFNDNRRIVGDRINERLIENSERLIENNKKIITLNEINEKECIICFEEYKEGDIIIELDCKHIYHDPCISKWLQKDLSCPICRSQLN